MKDKTAGLVQFALTALLAGGFGFWCARHFPSSPVPGGNIDVQVDSTVTQIDTATAVAPDPAEERIHDTIYIRVPIPAPSVPGSEENVPESPGSVPPVEDSVVYVPVILEEKVYEDSSYRAVVSGPAIAGYGPRLDSISTYNKTVTVYQTKTVYVEPSRWSIGIQAGYGASKDGLTSYVGIGVQYALWPRKRGKTPP